MILARSLSPQDRGNLANILLLPAFLSGIALNGIQNYLGIESAKNPNDFNKNYQIGIRILFVFSMLAIAIYFCVIFFLNFDGLNYGDLYYQLKIIPFLIIPFSVWNAFQIQMELGQNNIKIYNYGRASFSLSYFFANIILWFLKIKILTYYLYAFIFATIYAAISTAYISRNDYKFEKIKINGIDYKNVILDSWRFSISNTLVSIIAMVDRFSISVFLDSRSMAYYVVAMALSQVASILNEALSPLFFSRIANKKNMESVGSYWLAARLRQVMLLNVIIGILLIMITPILIPLIYGNSYDSSINVVMILLPAMCIKAMMRPYEETLKAGGFPLKQSYAIVAMAVTFIVCAFVAVKYQSLIGISLAVLFSSLIGLIILVISVSNKYNISYRNLLLAKPEDLVGLYKQLISIINVKI